MISLQQHDEQLKSKILKVFLEVFEKKLVQKAKPDFKHIFEQTIFILNLEAFKEEIYSEFEEFLQIAFRQITKQSYLNVFINDPSVYEILVHSQSHIQLDKAKLLHSETIHLLDPSLYQLSLESMSSQNLVEWNYKNPFASFNILYENIEFRATLIHYSITPTSCSKLFLRRISNSIITLQDFNINQEIERLLLNMIKAKKNILIAGSTGSGKTTFTKSLLSRIPDNEHIIVLEDTFEIGALTKSQSNLLANEKLQGKSLKDYCSYAMRMRPDRIIIGEMRSNEVVPFVLAMNTGHKGLMSTIHANSAVDAISRIALLFSIYSDSKDLNYELIIKLITQNIDYIIYLDKKNVTQIIKVLGSENGIPFYENIIDEIQASIN